jgi:lipopolysaccharide export system permease protein
VFGVAIFTALIMAGTYLFTITGFIVSGVPAMTLMEFTLLLLPGILVKTFAMAMLLATLLAFGRLSSDSEIVAMKASGASVPRMMIPVAVFGFVVAICAFALNEKVVYAAAKRGQELRTEIEKKVKGNKQSVSQTINDPKTGRLKGMLLARDFNLGLRKLEDAFIIAFNEKEKPTEVIYAPSLKFTDFKHWKMAPGAVMMDMAGTHIFTLGETFPSTVTEPPSPDDIMASNLKDLDVFNMGQMREEIEKRIHDPGFDPKQLANLQYGYYNKISLPLATFIFALVGAPLGIRSHRTGAATGFWLSVIIIFSYMLLGNLMNIWAMGLKIPAYAASFTPLAVGLVFSIVLIVRKNN